MNVKLLLAGAVVIALFFYDNISYAEQHIFYCTGSPEYVKVKGVYEGNYDIKISYSDTDYDLTLYNKTNNKFETVGEYGVYVKKGKIEISKNGTTLFNDDIIVTKKMM